MSPWLLSIAAVGIGVPRGLRLRRLRRDGGLLGQDSVLMFTTAGPTCFAILEKPFESVTGLGNHQRARVGGVDVLLLLAADMCGQHRAGQDAGGQRGEQREGGGETVVADAFDEARL